MKRFVLYIVALVILLTTVRCTVSTTGGWGNTTTDSPKVWLSEIDATKTYAWEGESFDSVAHGNGVLRVIEDGKVIDERQVKAYYGALVDADVVRVSDREKYVGELQDEKFNGYGVYDKNGEVYIGHFVNSKPHGFLSWYKNGKPYYVGMWADGKFHGEGTLYKEDGSIKSGEWDNGNLTQTLVDVDLKNGHYNGYVKNNKPDGMGKMEYADGSLYSGKWKEGTYSGPGVYVCGTDTIVGDWENGKINGDVVYRSELFFYEGSMVDNYPTGIGNLTVEDNSFYTGNWIDGKRAGMGDMFYISGDSYSGEWDDNQFSGFGKYIYDKQKASYEGEWLDGLQNGQGYYRSPEFAYRGEWEKGWMDGEGELVFSNGDRYEGTVHENLLDGIGTYTFKDGNFYEGEFVEGQITGLGVFHFKNGTTFEGEFVNGKIYGDGTLNLVEDGKIVSITGFWTPDGKFPDSASILFPNGDLYEGPIVNGVPTDEGIWTSGEDRAKGIDNIENSNLHKANEFYKRNREMINWCLTGASVIVTFIPAYEEAINIALNSIDAGLAIASAAIDANEASLLGEDNSEQLATLRNEIALNVALIAVPKALKKLGKPLKKVTRSIAATKGAQTAGKMLAKESAIKFMRGKVYGKVVSITYEVLENGNKALKNNAIRKKTPTAVAKLFTRLSNQTILSHAFLDRIKKNPEIVEKLVLNTNGNSTSLRNNMLLIMGKKGRNWVARNYKIARGNKEQLQIEAHHILTGNLSNKSPLKEAQEIFIKYYGSLDHPINGFFAPKSARSLAKGSRHTKHTTEYNNTIAKLINDIEKQYGKKYQNNPEMMRRLIAERLDDCKRDLYRGKLAIGGGGHVVYKVMNIFMKPGGYASQEAADYINVSFIPSL